MTQEEKEFILFEFEPDFEDSIRFLFSRENLDGLFPVFFILYSYRHGYKISFPDDGGMTGYKKGKDDLQDRLFEASLLVFGGDESSFERMWELQELIESIDRELFLEIYAFLVQSAIGATNLIFGTQMNPNFRIARTMGNILAEHGCKTVMGAYSGIGAYAVACKGMKYTGIEGYAPSNLLAEFLCDAYDVKKTEFLSEDTIEDWTRRKFDAVIGNLPVDVDFFNVHRADMYLSAFNDLQNTFIKKLISRKTAKKCATLLVHFEFANYAKYDETRKTICNNGLLESVIALPEDIFHESLVPTYIVVLDFENRHDKATFYDARQSLRRQPQYAFTFSHNDYDIRECVKKSETVTVDYDTIEKLSWSFNPSVYLQDAVCKDGQELVRLGDLVEIVCGSMVKGERYIPSDRLSDRFEIISKHIVPSAPESGDGALVEGPSVLLSLTSGSRREFQNIRCGVCDELGRYSVEFFLPVLKPKRDKILPDYLALALTTDPSFAPYLKSVQEYWCDTVRRSYLLERKIPVITDMAEQKKAVMDALGRADMANITYNVILAGVGNNLHQYRTLLSKYGFNILTTSETVSGNDGLEEILTAATSKKTPLSRKADAVIFSDMIPYSKAEDEEPYSGFDAILDLRLSVASGLPFYVSSAATGDEIKKKAKISSRRLHYFENGRFFTTDTNGAPSEALFSSLREELDRMLSPESKVRSRHADAFIAAEWVDHYYADKDIHSTEIISEFLMATEEGVETDKTLSDLRNVAHRLIEILKECGAVPPLDNGAIPPLLYDNSYKDNKSGNTYIQDFPIMRRSLASSLVALIDIGNDSTHSFHRSINLGTAMLQSLLEFLIWLYERKEEFSGILTNYWHVSNGYEEHWEERIGTVEMKEVCHTQVWFSGNVRLYKDKKTVLKVGDKVSIRKCVKNTSNPRIQGISYIAFPRDSNNPDGYAIIDDV